MKTAKKMFPGLVLAGILLSSGCVKLWQKNLDIKTYMLEVARTAAPLESAVADRLWIDHVTVLSPYNIRNMVLRESEVEYTVSYYTELIIPPAENFRNAFYSWFAAGGIFKNVSISEREGSSHRLLVTVTGFYGDTRTNKAVLNIKVSLLDEKAKELRVLLSKGYVQRVPLSEVNTEDLIRAYNTALARILSDCEKDIAAALQ